MNARHQRDKRLHLHEVAPRDGLQNEAAFVDTDAKIALIDALSACGYAKIEVTSFTSPGRIARPAPALGADTDTVLESLGIDATTRDDWRARGVI
ncbi:Hydroxymethylglutaryl-CoA lyase YngG [Burkholderia multivorans]|nr:hypothetical protein [Burkholderia multivorans]MDR8762295.1 Hydroxymethylglutaryl-CoA lyase YngG [Burkholderia multivorans]MDR8768443.1 Hydroxymethylglutaryl-CoA lyase YngG [Burkholderia multivorans]MDR8772441.1 Hydroxymethylglutaryl-CoA lyase YngG [Burkholderia multivorans]MDR8790706.1 Hydroxymethylglutaryl-CoA lyase YngG [Burkholderia multivorans]MDR8797142.1 Hydroxymethylglutaryl-CoA lyase YngG [Burkholderia multivorans]